MHAGSGQGLEAWSPEVPEKLALKELAEESLSGSPTPRHRVGIGHAMPTGGGGSRADCDDMQTFHSKALFVYRCEFSEHEQTILGPRCITELTSLVASSVVRCI